MNSFHPCEGSMRIVADSSCELTESMKKTMDITLVPLSITLGDEHYRDDDDLNVAQMLDDISQSKEIPRSACPSPQEFMEAFKREGSVFVVTLTSALSGTYNSAVLAKELFVQEHQEKFIHVFDSKGSSVRETLIAMKIGELLERQCSEIQIVEEVERYIEKMSFYFQLGSLDTMIKNGRISKLKGFIANALNIRPILRANEKGEAELVENVRTEKKSIQKLVELIGESCENPSSRVLGISHCDALEKAEKLKSAVEEAYDFKSIFIVQMKGLSSLYTNRGGITLGF